MESPSWKVLIASLIMCAVNGQDVSWTWLTGSQNANVQKSGKQPGGRSGATYWMQSDNQTLWLFGGEHHVEHEQPGLLNDLWNYDVEDDTWELVHNGSSMTHSVPAPRHLAAGCGIIASYFVLFGGQGYNSDGTQRVDTQFNDTWLFYIPDRQWYTLYDIRAKLNLNVDETSPAARGDMASWCSSSHQMVIFGGFAEHERLHSDLWFFNLESLTWVESKRSAAMPRDSEFVSHLAYPKGRSGATTWIADNMLYMLGGNILANNQRSKHLMVGYTADMWQYDLITDEWMYMVGNPKVCHQPAVYGELGAPAVSNSPGCRRKAVSWTDGRGNLWMFGGDGVDGDRASVSVFQHSKLLSDIWYFDTKTFKWTWKEGSKLGDEKGMFDVSKSNYHPGSRCEAVSWTVGNDLFLFGGVGHDGNGHDGYLNDLWKLDVRLDTSVLRNKPYPGPVFALIAAAVGLIVFLVLIYSLNKKYMLLSTNRADASKARGKYNMIDVDAEEF